MKLGYIRVSTSDQNPDRQRIDLVAVGVERIFEEKISGRDADRPELKKLISFARDGDELFITSLDRLGRNLSDLLRLVELFISKKVRVRFLNENLDFDAGENASPVSKLMLSIVGAFSEFERSIIRQRQMEGIAIAKQKGIYKGRQRSITEKQVEKLNNLIRNGIPLSTAAKKVGMSRSTAYRYLRGSANDK